MLFGLCFIEDLMYTLLNSLWIEYALLLRVRGLAGLAHSASDQPRPVRPQRAVLLFTNRIGCAECRSPSTDSLATAAGEPQRRRRKKKTDTARSPNPKVPRVVMHIQPFDNCSLRYTLLYKFKYVVHSIIKGSSLQSKWFNLCRISSQTSPLFLTWDSAQMVQHVPKCPCTSLLSYTNSRQIVHNTTSKMEHFLTQKRVLLGF